MAEALMDKCDCCASLTVAMRLGSPDSAARRRRRKYRAHLFREGRDRGCVTSARPSSHRHPSERIRVHCAPLPRVRDASYPAGRGRCGARHD